MRNVKKCKYLKHNAHVYEIMKFQNVFLAKEMLLKLDMAGHGWTRLDTPATPELGDGGRRILRAG